MTLLSEAVGPRDAPLLEETLGHNLDGPQWERFLESGQSLAPDAIVERMRDLDPDDPINIQYTSGTTGFPKGATLSHRNILNNGYFVTELIGLTSADRLCIPVPFYH